MISMRANRWALANNRPPPAAGGGGASETTLVASAGALALTPQPATLTYDPAVAAAAGSLTLTPQPATLTYAPAPWTPASLPDLELWLANSSLAAIGDAQPISQWDDEGGNARHAVQATGTSQPTVRLNGDGIWEVKGDGVDDNMVSAFGATLAQPYTVWAVGSIAAANKLMVDGLTSGERASIYRRVTSGFFSTFSGAELIGPSGDADLHSFVAIFNGTLSKLRIDGTEVASGNVGAHSVSGLTLFALFNLTVPNAGVLRTLGANSSVLAGDDLANLETYLATLVP